MMNEFLSKAKEIASRAIQMGDAAINAVKDYLHRCDERKRVIEDYNNTQLNRERFGLFQMELQGDYDAFADAVYKCLQSNYQKLGLSRPNDVEDVSCTTDWQKGILVSHIDGNYQNIVFRYEADRRISDMWMGGMKKTEQPQVSTDDILVGLWQKLPIYTKRRGYGFKALDVIDIPNNRVRITIYGVYMLPAFNPQMPWIYGGVM